MMYKDNISLIVTPEYPLQGMLGGLAFDGCPSCLKGLGALVWVELGFVDLICTLPRFRTLWDGGDQVCQCSYPQR